MKAFSVVAIFAALSAAAAVPKTTYLLQVETVDGGQFDGYFVTALHTFAGTNAAGITRHGGTPAYLKGEELFFNLGKSKADQYPMQLDLTDESAAWGTTSINAGKPTKRFAMTKSGHLIVNHFEPQRIFNEEDKGSHWRVCTWTHGVPELFWNFPATTDNINPKYNPSICSLVNLKMVKHT